MFFKKKECSTDVFCSWVTLYRNEFINLEDDDIDIEYILEIFDEATNIILSLGSKNLTKVLRKSHINEDFATLNIIQNTAMTIAQSGTMKDFLLGGKTSVAISIYRFINNKKMELHYISPKQYKENDTLIDYILSSLNNY